MSDSIDLQTRSGRLHLTTFAINGLQITACTPDDLKDERFPGIGYATFSRDELDELIECLVWARDRGSYAEHPKRVTSEAL